MIEVWKDIEGYPNYQVSNLGRIYSKPRPRTKGGIMTAMENKCGYLKVFLNKEGKGHLVSIHRLVAKAFIPNVNNLLEVNHIDGNKKNNNVENLEWVTKSENIRHRFNVLKQQPHRKYVQENYTFNSKEEVNRYARDYYKRNKERLLEYGRQWRKKRKSKQQFEQIKYKVKEN